VRHLICADIELENAKETANQARQIGQDHSLKEATAFLVDVRQEADVQGLFEKAKAQAGRIDICVNTAGVSHRR
jgi:NAD(P)-dependent dehydrogenase (short-subunit alcohol dehydrogenase family)